MTRLSSRDGWKMTRVLTFPSLVLRQFAALLAALLERPAPLRPAEAVVTVRRRVPGRRRG